MPSNATVSRFRISAIWPAWTSQILERPAAPATPALLRALAGPIAYSDLFREAAGREAAGVGLPWADAVEHEFWRQFSTRSGDPVSPHIIPRNAARHLVPVHASGAAPEKPPWKLSLHHFVYPFGVACVLHAEFPHPDPGRRGSSPERLTLRDVVEACYDLRGDEEAGSADSWERFVADSVGDASGLLGGATLQLQAPMSVVTFLEVDDVLELDPTERDQVLNALTGWPERKGWDKVALEERPGVELAPKRRVQGRVVHAARRGRSIWFPDGFSGGTTLSEAHRRFCFMTMQTEMLIRFMSETAEVLDDLPPAWEGWAPRGAATIGLVYGDDQLAAWDSSSPRVQIDSSGATPAINAVRKRFELEPLHP